VQSQGGRSAQTIYRVVRRFRGFAELDVQLLTGRTHQIRVHLAHIGCPLVGDERYGDEDADKVLFASIKAPKRLYLHAAKVSFRHPLTNAPLTIEAPLPEAFDQLMKACGGKMQPA
jgi:23S rRNA pseudouridine955/2504/2580 synthase